MIKDCISNGLFAASVAPKTLQPGTGEHTPLWVDNNTPILQTDIFTMSGIELGSIRKSVFIPKE